MPKRYEFLAVVVLLIGLATGSVLVQRKTTPPPSLASSCRCVDDGMCSSREDTIPNISCDANKNGFGTACCGNAPAESAPPQNNGSTCSENINNSCGHIDQGFCTRCTNGQPEYFCVEGVGSGGGCIAQTTNTAPATTDTTTTTTQTASSHAQDVRASGKCDINFGLCQAIDPKTGEVTGWVPATKPVFCDSSCALAARMNIVVGNAYTSITINGTPYQAYDWNVGSPTSTQAISLSQLTPAQVATIKQTATANQVGVTSTGFASVNLTQAQITDLQKRVDAFNSQQTAVQQAILADIISKNQDPAQITNFKYLTPDNQSSVTTSYQNAIQAQADSNARVNTCLDLLKNNISCKAEIPNISDSEISSAKKTQSEQITASQLANKYQSGQTLTPDEIAQVDKYYDMNQLDKARSQNFVNQAFIKIVNEPNVPRQAYTYNLSASDINLLNSKLSDFYALQNSFDKCTQKCNDLAQGFKTYGYSDADIQKMVDNKIAQNALTYNLAAPSLTQSPDVVELNKNQIVAHLDNQTQTAIYNNLNTQVQIQNLLTSPTASPREIIDFCSNLTTKCQETSDIYQARDLLANTVTNSTAKQQLLASNQNLKQNQFYEIQAQSADFAQNQAKAVVETGLTGQTTSQCQGSTLHQSGYSVVFGSSASPATTTQDTYCQYGCNAGACLTSPSLAQQQILNQYSTIFQRQGEQGISTASATFRGDSALQFALATCTSNVPPAGIQTCVSNQPLSEWQAYQTITKPGIYNPYITLFPDPANRKQFEQLVIDGKTKPSDLIAKVADAQTTDIGSLAINFNTLSGGKVLTGNNILNTGIAEWNQGNTLQGGWDVVRGAVIQGYVPAQLATIAVAPFVAGGLALVPGSLIGAGLADATTVTATNIISSTVATNFAISSSAHTAEVCPDIGLPSDLGKSWQCGLSALNTALSYAFLPVSALSGNAQIQSALGTQYASVALETGSVTAQESAIQYQTDAIRSAAQAATPLVKYGAPFVFGANTFDACIIHNTSATNCVTNLGMFVLSGRQLFTSPQIQSSSVLKVADIGVNTAILATGCSAYLSGQSDITGCINAAGFAFGSYTHALTPEGPQVLPSSRTPDQVLAEINQVRQTDPNSPRIPTLESEYRGAITNQAVMEAQRTTLLAYDPRNSLQKLFKIGSESQEITDLKLAQAELPNISDPTYVPKLIDLQVSKAVADAKYISPDSALASIQVLRPILDSQLYSAKRNLDVAQETAQQFETIAKQVDPTHAQDYLNKASDIVDAAQANYTKLQNQLGELNQAEKLAQSRQSPQKPENLAQTGPNLSSNPAENLNDFKARQKGQDLYVAVSDQNQNGLASNIPLEAYDPGRVGPNPSSDQIVAVYRNTAYGPKIDNYYKVIVENGELKFQAYEKPIDATVANAAPSSENQTFNTAIVITATKAVESLAIQTIPGPIQPLISALQIAAPAPLEVIAGLFGAKSPAQMANEAKLEKLATINNQLLLPNTVGTTISIQNNVVIIQISPQDTISLNSLPIIAGNLTLQTGDTVSVVANQTADTYVFKGIENSQAVFTRNTHPLTPTAEVPTPPTTPVANRIGSIINAVAKPIESELNTAISQISTQVVKPLGSVVVALAQDAINWLNDQPIKTPSAPAPAITTLAKSIIAAAEPVSTNTGTQIADSRLTSILSQVPPTDAQKIAGEINRYIDSLQNPTNKTGNKIRAGSWDSEQLLNAVKSDMGTNLLIPGDVVNNYDLSTPIARYVIQKLNPSQTAENFIVANDPSLNLVAIGLAYQGHSTADLASAVSTGYEIPYSTAANTVVPNLMSISSLYPYFYALGPEKAQTLLNNYPLQTWQAIAAKLETAKQALGQPVSTSPDDQSLSQSTQIYQQLKNHQVFSDLKPQDQETLYAVATVLLLPTQQTKSVPEAAPIKAPEESLFAVATKIVQRTLVLALPLVLTTAVVLNSLLSQPPPPVIQAPPPIVLVAQPSQVPFLDSQIGGSFSLSQSTSYSPTPDSHNFNFSDTSYSIAPSNSKVNQPATNVDGVIIGNSLYPELPGSARQITNLENQNVTLISSAAPIPFISADGAKVRPNTPTDINGKLGYYNSEGVPQIYAFGQDSAGNILFAQHTPLTWGVINPQSLYVIKNFAGFAETYILPDMTMVGFSDGFGSMVMIPFQDGPINISNQSREDILNLIQTLPHDTVPISSLTYDPIEYSDAQGNLVARYSPNLTRMFAGTDVLNDSPHVISGVYELYTQDKNNPVPSGKFVVIKNGKMELIGQGREDFFGDGKLYGPKYVKRAVQTSPESQALEPVWVPSNSFFGSELKVATKTYDPDTLNPTGKILIPTGPYYTYAYETPFHTIYAVDASAQTRDKLYVKQEPPRNQITTYYDSRGNVAAFYIPLDRNIPNPSAIPNVFINLDVETGKTTFFYDSNPSHKSPDTSVYLGEQLPTSSQIIQALAQNNQTDPYSPILFTANNQYRPLPEDNYYPELTKPDKIVIHTSEQQDPAKDWSNDITYRGLANDGMSAHLGVDSHGTAQFLPMTEEFVAKGKSVEEGNTGVISIELAGRTKDFMNQNPQVVKATISNTVQTTADVMQKYGITYDNVVGHFEISGQPREDPGPQVMAEIRRGLDLELTRRGLKLGQPSQDQVRTSVSPPNTQSLTEIKAVQDILNTPSTKLGLVDRIISELDHSDHSQLVNNPQFVSALRHVERNYQIDPAKKQDVQCLGWAITLAGINGSSIRTNIGGITIQNSNWLAHGQKIGDPATQVRQMVPQSIIDNKAKTTMVGNTVAVKVNSINNLAKGDLFLLYANDNHVGAVLDIEKDVLGNVSRILVSDANRFRNPDGSITQDGKIRTRWLTPAEFKFQFASNNFAVFRSPSSNTQASHSSSSFPAFVANVAGAINPGLVPLIQSFSENWPTITTQFDILRGFTPQGLWNFITQPFQNLKLPWQKPPTPASNNTPPLQAAKESLAAENNLNAISETVVDDLETAMGSTGNITASNIGDVLTNLRKQVEAGISPDQPGIRVQTSLEEILGPQLAKDITTQIIAHNEPVSQDQRLYGGSIVVENKSYDIGGYDAILALHTADVRLVKSGEKMLVVTSRQVGDRLQITQISDSYFPITPKYANYLQKIKNGENPGYFTGLENEYHIVVRNLIIENKISGKFFDARSLLPNDWTLKYIPGDARFGQNFNGKTITYGEIISPVHLFALFHEDGHNIFTANDTPALYAEANSLWQQAQFQIGGPKSLPPEIFNRTKELLVKNERGASARAYEILRILRQQGLDTGASIQELADFTNAALASYEKVYSGGTTRFLNPNLFDKVRPFIQKILSGSLKTYELSGPNISTPHQVRFDSQSGKVYELNGTEITNLAPNVVLDDGKSPLILQDGTWVPLQEGNGGGGDGNIPGMPAGLEIKSPSWGSPESAREMIFLSHRDDWLISIQQNDEELRLFVKPTITQSPTVKNIGDGRYIDQDLATTENGEITLIPNSGYRTDQPNDKALYRGIYYDELVDIILSGEIQAKGNLGSGLIFFADGTQDPQQAVEFSLGYANHGQWSRLPSFEKPNFLLVVKKPDRIPSLTGSIEVAYSGSINAKEIIAIYEVRPYLIKEGSYPLESGDGWISPSFNTDYFYRRAPKVSTVYKRLTYEEAVNKFSPPQSSTPTQPQTTTSESNFDKAPTISGPGQPLLEKLGLQFTDSTGTHWKLPGSPINQTINTGEHSGQVLVANTLLKYELNNDGTGVLIYHNPSNPNLFTNIIPGIPNLILINSRNYLVSVSPGTKPGTLTLSSRPFFKNPISFRSLSNFLTQSKTSIAFQLGLPIHIDLAQNRKGTVSVDNSYLQFELTDANKVIITNDSDGSVNILSPETPIATMITNNHNVRFHASYDQNGNITSLYYYNEINSSINQSSQPQTQKDPCAAWNLIPSAMAAGPEGNSNPCPIFSGVWFDHQFNNLVQAVGGAGGAIQNIIQVPSPTPLPESQSGERPNFLLRDRDYQCTGKKDDVGNDLITDGYGITYYCDGNFGMFCQEGRCSTNPKNINFAYIAVTLYDKDGYAIDVSSSENLLLKNYIEDLESRPDNATFSYQFEIPAELTKNGKSVTFNINLSKNTLLQAKRDKIIRISQITDLEFNHNLAFKRDNLNISTIENKYKIVLQGGFWTDDTIKILDKSLSGLPANIYQYRIFSAQRPNSLSSRAWGNAYSLNIPTINIDWSQGINPRVVWHELAHSSSNYLGVYRTDRAPNYNVRAISDLMTQVGWYFDSKENKYKIYPQSPALNGYFYNPSGINPYSDLLGDKTPGWYVKNLCQKDTKNCNIYRDYQFSNPQEMFAVWGESYVSDSQLFCKQLPSYCHIMTDFYEGRTYKDGVWLNEPTPFGK